MEHQLRQSDHQTQYEQLCMICEGHEELVTKLLAALRGIASCGTACKCCEMHREIALKAIENLK